MKTVRQGQQTIRQKMMTKRTELQRRLEQITQDARRAKKPLEADWEEQAVERENDEVLDALGDATCAELARIDATLGRLDRGGYGICEACGRKIPRARLAALPDASRCVTCEEKMGTVRGA